MTAATARHADARLTPSPAKVATCLGTSHASGSPTRPEDDSSSPASPDTPEAFPRARANPADAPGASAAPENAERLFLPGEARNGSRSSRAVGSAGSDAKRHPSFKKTHWVKDKDAKACGHKPCSRPFTVLLRRHHCRACGQLVCDECSRTRLQLAGSDNLKRACDVCAAARRDATEQERRGAGTAVADPRELL